MIKFLWFSHFHLFSQKLHTSTRQSRFVFGLCAYSIALDTVTNRRQPQYRFHEYSRQFPLQTFSMPKIDLCRAHSMVRARMTVQCLRLSEFIPRRLRARVRVGDRGYSRSDALFSSVAYCQRNVSAFPTETFEVSSMWLYEMRQVWIRSTILLRKMSSCQHTTIRGPICQSV